MLLVGAITLGMRVPRQELLRDFDSDGKLDYLAYASLFAPLSAGFISEMLGLEQSFVARADGANEGLQAAAASDEGVDAAAAPTAQDPAIASGRSGDDHRDGGSEARPP